MTTTAITIEYTVVGTARCPLCRKELTLTRLICEGEAEFTDAIGVVAEVRSGLAVEKERRGWTDESCGACRDQEVKPAKAPNRKKHVAPSAPKA